MDKFDLKNYLTEGKIYESNFTSTGYKIIDIDQSEYSPSKGFLPVKFNNFQGEVNSNSFNSVKDFIQDDIYKTLSIKIDDVYSWKKKDFEKKIKLAKEKIEDKWQSDEMSEEEYENIKNEIDHREEEFNKGEAKDLVILDMDDDDGEYKIEHPITGKTIMSGKFEIF